MGLFVGLGQSTDAAAIAAVEAAAAADLTRRYGKGHWSYARSEAAVLRDVNKARVLVAHEGDAIVGTLCLQKRKPWAIDPAYFTTVARPLYLTAMAVSPARQRSGIGRLLLEAARQVTNDLPADAIRLDAYDSEAGAGGFYERCGFRETGRVTYRGTPLVYYELLLDSEEAP